MTETNSTPPPLAAASPADTLAAPVSTAVLATSTADASAAPASPPLAAASPLDASAATASPSAPIASDTQLDATHLQAMQDKQARRRAERATKTLRGGLLMVLTGPGKGKSSSAFGMVARALGWDMRVGIVQYIKGKWQTGERHFFRRFPDLVTYEVMGEGFTWDVQDRQRDIAAAAKAWQRSREMIEDPDYDLVLLDELNIALRNDYLPIDEVVAFLRERPRDKHICITGRDAKPALLEIADLVTEMTLVKHPYQAGYKAQKGVEF